MSIEVIGLIMSGLTALGTLGAVGVALWLGLSQQRANTLALRDSHRPILSPKEALFFRGVINVHADQSVTATEKSGDFDFSAPHNAFFLRNVGPGVALNVDGVIMGPAVSLSQLEATIFRVDLDMPFPANTGQFVYAGKGRLMLSATDEIVPGWILGAPADPGTGRLEGEKAISLRLTLTCSDIFNRVHAFIYEYSENHRWLYRDSQIVKQSIDDRNRAAMDERMPKPLQGEPAPQYIRGPSESD